MTDYNGLNMEKDFNAFIIGYAGSGKTNLVLNIIQYFKF